jgi:hypothetical protein
MKKSIRNNSKLKLDKQTIQLLNSGMAKNLKAGVNNGEQGTTIYVSIAIATQTLSDARCIWICANL